MNINNDIALFLLELAKQNEYSNDEIKIVHFVDVIDVVAYSNTNNRNDKTTIYCVYADYIEDNNKHRSTAEFYFSVEYSHCYNNDFDTTKVYYLYAINQH